jgi:hypothetical protein
MNRKRPIDMKRETGGMFDVGTPEEGSAGPMFEIKNSLYVVKEKAIYAVQFADQIDPERKNFELPKTVHHLVFSEGSDSELVSRTFLTAATLFAGGKYLPKNFDYSRALVLSLDALTSMLQMRASAMEFDTGQQQAYAKAEAGPRTESTMQCPSMGDVRARCKTFVHQSYHTQGTLLNIVKLFHNDIKEAPWDTLLAMTVQRHGEDDRFTKFLRAFIPFLKLVLNTRNCLDHDGTKGVVRVQDFTLRNDGKIVYPTIEVDFRESKIPPVPISFFMTRMVDSMSDVFENMIAHLCSKHVQSPMPNFTIQVGLIPENHRQMKLVRFGYGTYIGDDFVPIH